MNDTLDTEIKIAVHRDGQTVHVQLAGVLDSTAAPHVRSSIKPALKEGATDLILDLSDVSYVDQTGVDGLIHAARIARRLGGQVVLRNCPEQVIRLLAALGRDHLFTYR
ncbi:MAG TPA: STAS domain-containing protein [Armatimonadota bacterium]|nr:STAS domain-containing protein [Armatimonadota bacterium]